MGMGSSPSPGSLPVRPHEVVGDGGAQVEPHRRRQPVARLGLEEAEERAEGEPSQHRRHLLGVPAQRVGAEEAQRRAHAGAADEPRRQVELLQQVEGAQVGPGHAAAAAADQQQRLLAALAVERGGVEPALEGGQQPASPLAGRATRGEASGRPPRSGRPARARRRASWPPAGPRRGRAPGSPPTSRSVPSGSRTLRQARQVEGVAERVLLPLVEPGAAGSPPPGPAPAPPPPAGGTRAFQPSITSSDGRAITRWPRGALDWGLDDTASM